RTVAWIGRLGSTAGAPDACGAEEGAAAESRATGALGLGSGRGGAVSAAGRGRGDDALESDALWATAAGAPRTAAIATSSPADPERGRAAGGWRGGIMPKSFPAPRVEAPELDSCAQIANRPPPLDHRLTDTPRGVETEPASLDRQPHGPGGPQRVPQAQTSD